MSLAKHEVGRRKKSGAPLARQGRIENRCGALDFGRENGDYSVGSIDRRDISDPALHRPSRRDRIFWVACRRRGTCLRPAG